MLSTPPFFFSLTCLPSFPLPICQPLPLSLLFFFLLWCCLNSSSPFLTFSVTLLCFSFLLSVTVWSPLLDAFLLPARLFVGFLPSSLTALQYLCQASAEQAPLCVYVCVFGSCSPSLAVGQELKRLPFFPTPSLSYSVLPQMTGVLLHVSIFLFHLILNIHIFFFCKIITFFILLYLFSFNIVHETYKKNRCKKLSTFAFNVRTS